MKTLAEIQEELTAIQDLLGPGDVLIIEYGDIRLELLGVPIVVGPQAVAAFILEEHHAAKD